MPTDKRLTAAVLAQLPAQAGKPLLIAIDGRCGAGKTTLANALQQEIGCTVLHMDDFFLRPEQRTPQRYQEPGGNVDYERFLQEVMISLRENQPFSYRPYDCVRQILAEPVSVCPQPITVVEGSYSCHPTLWDFYDFRVFLTVDPDEQLRRIRMRNGEEKLKIFQSKWIPLEECYFRRFAVESRCDLRLDTHEKPPRSG